MPNGYCLYTLLGNVYYGYRKTLPRKVFTYIRDEKKIGRNEPCKCGSNKKYKKCCGG